MRSTTAWASSCTTTEYAQGQHPWRDTNVRRCSQRWLAGVRARRPDEGPPAPASAWSATHQLALARPRVRSQHSTRPPARRMAINGRGIVPCVVRWLRATERVLSALAKQYRVGYRGVCCLHAGEHACASLMGSRMIFTCGCAAPPGQRLWPAATKVASGRHVDATARVQGEQQLIVASRHLLRPVEWCTSRIPGPPPQHQRTSRIATGWRRVSSV
jgi:hypothetical protein